MTLGELVKQTVEITDECGNVDLCEVEGTRVIRVIRRVKHGEPTAENREYSILYSHACGYRD
jgi:hypothetical protein